MKFFSTLLILIIFTHSLLEAKKYTDKGLYGSLNFMYFNDEYKNTKRLNKQQNFIQEYRMGYIGNLYSPRLLDYTVEGLLRYEKLDIQDRTADGQTRIDSQDYKFNLSFIKETKYPFTVYAKKTDRPVVTLYNSSSIRNTQNLENYGVAGSMKFRPLVFSYGVSKEKNLRNGYFSEQNTDTLQYKSSLRRTRKNYNIVLSYTRLERDYTTKYKDTNSTINEVDDTIDFIYRLDINKELTFDSGLRYVESDYYKNKTSEARANLRWHPKTKYSATISAVATQTQSYYSQDVNNTDTTITDILNLNQTFSYRALESLIFTQNANFYTYKRALTDGMNSSLRIGVNYNKNISRDTRILLNSSVDTRINRLERISRTTNLSENDDKNSYTWDTRAGVIEKLPSIYSTFNLNVRYYLMRSNIEDITDRYSADSSLSTIFSRSLRNYMSASYLYETGAFSLFQGTVRSKNIKRIDLNEALDYIIRLNVRGRITGQLGMRYTQTDNLGKYITHEVPRAKIDLKYRFFRRINFSSALQIDKDLSYNILNYSATTNLSYMIRKTSFSMGYQYYKIQIDDNTQFGSNLAGFNTQLDSRRTRFDIRLSRKF